MTDDALLPPILPAPEWFHVDATRQQQGPLTTDELLARLRSGAINRDTLVWKDGMADWQPLNALPELAAPAAPAAASSVAAVEPLPAMAAIAPAEAAIDRSDIVYAGFWRRVAAYWLDSIIVGIASYVIIIPMSIFMGVSAAGLEQAGNSDAAAMAMMPMMLGMYAIIFAMQAVYFAWMHSRPAQATLGKMAVGIKVADDNGGRISFARGIGRYFAFLLGVLTLYIGWIMAAFTDRKRALHDMICHTVVVDRWAYTAHPQLQKRGLDGVTIAILVIGGLLLLLFIAAMGLIVAAASSGSWN